MTNNFSTVKLNQASDKFQLIRVETARYITDDLAEVGGGIWSVTLPHPFIHDVQEDGVSLTQVYTTPGAGEFYYNISTKVLLIYPTDETNDIVAFGYLFFSQEINQIVPVDPMSAESSTTNPKMDWIPRLTGVIGMNQSVENILEGKLTISASSFRVINSANEFEKYFTANDTFYQKNITAWDCLDTTDNIRVIINGNITSLSMSGGDSTSEIMFRLEDRRASFSKPAYMGDNVDEVNYTVDTYATLDPVFEGKPIPYFFGNVSRYLLKSVSGTAYDAAYPQSIIAESMHEAGCISYTEQLATTVNRTWLSCRVSSSGMIDLGFTPSAFVDNGSYWEFSLTSVANYHIGDTFYSSAALTPHAIYIIGVNRSTNKIYVIDDPGITGSDAYLSNYIPTVCIYDSEAAVYYNFLKYNIHYTATEHTTSYGNKYYKIVFKDNFEALLSMSTLDPRIHRVYFRAHPGTANKGHATVLQNIIEAAGETINAASFTTAASDRAGVPNFSIPFWQEGYIGQYNRYIEKLLQSTVGYIYLNNDFEFCYGIFQTLSASTALNSADYLERSLTQEIEYKDIRTKVFAHNIHTPELSASSETLENLKARFMVGQEELYEHIHVLEDYSTVIADILALVSNRRTKYLLTAPTKALETLIGDQFLLTTNRILGTAGTDSLIVLGTQRVNDGVQLVLTDLEGL